MMYGFFADLANSYHVQLHECRNGFAAKRQVRDFELCGSLTRPE